MNRDEALQLLRGGEAGVAEWNRRRDTGELIPSLAAAKLHGAHLNDANLSQVDLGNATLINAHLGDASLHQADLSSANLGGADLRSVNLSGTVLSHATLDRANLFGANLRDASLRESNLNEANISRADLRGATLNRAYLNGVVLDDANLSGADLRGASFRRAYLCNTDFDESVCAATSFAALDLSDAVRLETVRHWGESHVDTQTLFLSRGKIPRNFLQGCGVADNLITYLPSLLADAIDFYTCFISYSHEDKSFAQRLHDQLQARGIRCWLDEHELLPGDDIYKAVDRGIRLWDKVLLCASKSSLTSWWVDREINTAIEKEQQLHKERGERALAIIPLNLDGHLFAWNGEQAAELRRRLAADFTGWESDNAKFKEQFEKVVKALKTERTPAPEGKL